ncbi:metallophosphoesterase family protein [Proteobacteria bacterium 005FR1]|nr:metallophosphoesterase family protein [Proteobacteria bacterium 005FR1]
MMSATNIGLISDTHGLLRPQALEALRGSDLIIHTGDIGPGEIIEQLGEIADTEAIKGNIDKPQWAAAYPDTRLLTVEGRRIYLIHNIKDLDFDPAEEGVDVVIAGHSHKPVVREENGVLYVNPGSAGPRRFKLPVCVACLRVASSGIKARIIELEV